MLLCESLQSQWEADAGRSTAHTELPTDPFLAVTQTGTKGTLCQALWAKGSQCL